MINDRDSSCDYNMKSSKLYETPYCIGEILENKKDSNIYAMICEIRINRKGNKYLIGFDRTTDDFIDTKLVTEEELIDEWNKLINNKIVLWGNISKKPVNLEMSKMMDEMYGRFEMIDEGIQLVKKK